MTSTRRPRRLVAGALVGLASLSAAYAAAAPSFADLALFADRPTEVAPLPAALIPAGAAAPPAGAPLSPAQRAKLRRALWADPLDQRLVNLLYVEAVRAGGLGEPSAPTARALARLGWRSTAAQGNLMVRAGVDGHYADVANRADALLRRQKVSPQTMAMLMAMEATPQAHDLVVAKLAADPAWRHDYLLRVAPGTPAPILDARLRTLRVLLRSPGGVARDELSPLLNALVAAGRARDADALWAHAAGPRPPGNLVRDPQFRDAGRSHRTHGDVPIPFEWRLGDGLGYSTDATADGVTVTWDGRGVPTFLDQLVPVEPGRVYSLTIAGRADSGALRDLLTPALACGGTSVAFTAVEGGAAGARFRSAAVPAGCTMADLTLSGSVDVGTNAAAIDLRRITLRSAG